ncbi:MAG: glycosyltransferase family 2 protein [Pirellulales bacterium]|nr:glycosyltransferase family 2 protein [Pirellulales bacterium]
MNAAFQPSLASVIVPTHNRAGLLVESIDSVFGQTYRPIELVIVDDGSTDDTEMVVKAWSQTHAAAGQFTVKYIYQAKSGAPSARNRGLAESKSEFIQFLDSDDVLHPEKLQRQIELLAFAPDVDYVYSEAGRFEVAPDWNVPPCFGRATTALLSDHLSKSTLNSICGLYRRRLCRRIGPWNVNLLKWQDWEYNLRMLALRPRCVHLPGVYCLARVHSLGQIADLASQREGIEAMALAVASAERTLRNAGLLVETPTQIPETAEHGPNCQEHKPSGHLVESPSEHADLSPALAARYFLVAMEAIRNGFPRVARDATYRGLQHRPNRGHRLRLELLRGLAILPPAWASRGCDLLLRTCGKVKQNITA